jgi:hypothetical protein
LSSLRQSAATAAASSGKKTAVKATDEVINRWLDEDDDQPSITLSRAIPSPAASPASTPFYQRPVSSVFYGGSGSGGSTVSASPYAAPSPYRPASSFSAAGAGSSGYPYATTPSYFFGGGGGYNSLMSPSPATAAAAAAATPSM